jgi:crossover junction endodeoxyribonuclease RuvC
MIILGIDPGTATTGYGILEIDGDSMSAIEFGLIETSKDATPEKRLSYIYAELNTIIGKFSPDIMAIEKVFFSTNARTAIRVGQAIGVMLLSASTADLPVAEYAPGTIKKLC